jgi:integrase
MGIKDDRGWNLYQRGDGQWTLSFRTAPGKWRETRVPRQHHGERAAERYARAWLEEYRKRLGDRPVVPQREEDPRPTIRSLAEKWALLCQNNPKLSPATRCQYATSITAHVLPYAEIADTPIAELGPATLRAWLRKVRDEGKVSQKWETRDGRRVRSLVRGGKLAPFTCRNIVGSLTAFFADVMAEEWAPLLANPMKHEAVRREVPEGRTLAGKHTIVHFSRPVAERLLASGHTAEWRRVRTLLALTSGMAEGELSGLRWDDLELDASLPVARVTKALAVAGAGGWATLGRTKTENRVRTLPLHGLAVRALRAWKAAGWAQWVGHAPKPTDSVFPNASGHGWRPTMAAMLRADLRAAGLPDQYEGHPYTAHATRRSFATWLNEAGVAEGTLKRLMGHASSGETQQHYTAQTLAALKAAVEAIRLDLSAGELVTLPMRAVGTGKMPPQTVGLTADFTAGLTAGRGKESTQVPEIPGAILENRTRDLRFTKPLLYP